MHVIREKVVPLPADGKNSRNSSRYYWRWSFWNGVQGAYVPIEDVESGDDRVILIGDAGGFPNKLTYEGLYYAIATARNAFEAIKEGRSFSETNRDIFKRKKYEKNWAKLFYSPLGLWITRTISHYPKLLKFIIDHGVR